VARYGVFLRPDPLTCAAVTRITDQLRAQYGLVSAGAFPPHATLAGSLPVGDRAGELEAALSERLAGITAFPVFNSGIVRMRGGLVYAIHELFGAPNAALRALAAAVDEAVRPYLAPARPGEPDAGVSAPGEWVGHLSLASHDLAARPDLLDEVEDYVRGLQLPYPTTFTAGTVALYRFEAARWTGPWWRELRWEHVRSFRLRTG
jgi:hypothetical protein